MPDIDRLIEAWEIFRDSNPYEICNGREFRATREPEYCMGQMIEDTLSLLREQEPKPVELRINVYGTKFYYCPKCKRELFHTRNLNFCERCGQGVKWE